jgi:hypothetical protein
MYSAKPPPHHLHKFTAWFLCRAATVTCLSSGFTLISQQPYGIQVRGKECMEEYHYPSLLPMQLQGLVLNRAQRPLLYTHLILGFRLIS